VALSGTGMRLRLRVVACPIRDIVPRCLDGGSASSSSATGNESTFVAMSKFYGNVGIWTGPLGTIPPVIKVTSLKKPYEPQIVAAVAGQLVVTTNRGDPDHTTNPTSVSWGAAGARSGQSDWESGLLHGPPIWVRLRLSGLVCVRDIAQVQESR